VLMKHNDLLNPNLCCLLLPQVVRGGAAFAVSLVVSSIEPVLRQGGSLCPWQLLSIPDN